MGREVRTSQLEQNASASRDLCTSLAHPLECQQDLLLVAAQHATRKGLYVMAVIEKVHGGPQHADMRLRRLIGDTDNVDSQTYQHSILEFVLVEKGEDLRCRHRRWRCRTSRVRRSRCVIGLAKGYSPTRK